MVILTVIVLTISGKFFIDKNVKTCFILIQLNSKNDLNKLDKESKKEVFIKIEKIGSGIENYIRIGNFKVLISSMQQKCDEDLIKLNNNLIISNKENRSETSIIVKEMIKFNIDGLLLYLYILIITSLTVSTFYLSKILLFKINFK